MTAKEIKYMEILKRYFAVGQDGDDKGYAAVIECALDFDYALAVKLWDYTLTENESKLTDAACASVYSDEIEAIFVKTNAIRLAKTISENAVIRNAIYRYSQTSFTRPEPIGYLSAALTSGKTAEAEEIMKSAVKNASGEFGVLLLTATVHTITEALKKSAKNPIPKKVATLILAYADKVKGEEKALIYQRIRELG